MKTSLERAGDRLTMDYPVTILKRPVRGKRLPGRGKDMNKGALVIDLGKRRKGAPGHGDWGPADELMHPRNPKNGKFIDAVGAGHGAVADLLHGLVKEHGGEDTPLGRSLMEHIGRAESVDNPTRPMMAKPKTLAQETLEQRKQRAHGAEVSRVVGEGAPLMGQKKPGGGVIGAADVAAWHNAQAGKPNPAKPLRTTKSKGLDESTVTRLKDLNAISRPTKENHEELKTILAGMTVPQLKEAADHLGMPSAAKGYKNKTELAANVAYIMGGKRAHNAILYGAAGDLSRVSFLGGSEGKSISQLEREAAAMAQARENSLAIQGMPAGGKTLWEMSEEERSAHFAKNREAIGGAESDHRDYLGGESAPKASEPTQAEKLSDLTNRIDASGDPALRAELIWERHKLTQEMGIKSTRSPSPERLRRAGITRDTRGNAPVVKPGKPDKAQLAEARGKRIDAMIADPQPEDREKLRAELAGMTVAEIKALQERHGGTFVNQGTKPQKVSRAVENLVGFKLNSKVIQGTNWMTGEKLGGGLAGAPVRKMSTNPRAENTWGAPTGKADEIHYHADGEIGWAADRLGADTKLEVQGDSLQNRLDRIATDTVIGKTSPAQQIDELKKLHAELPPGPGKNAVAGAIRGLDVPIRPAPVMTHEDTPQPVKDMIEGLAKIPLMSARGNDSNATQSDQVSALWQAIQHAVDEIAARKAAGRNPKIYFSTMSYELSANVPHESLEGSAEIRALINAKMKELEGR